MTNLILNPSFSFAIGIATLVGASVASNIAPTLASSEAKEVAVADVEGTVPVKMAVAEDDLEELAARIQDLLGELKRLDADPNATSDDLADVKKELEGLLDKLAALELQGEENEGEQNEGEEAEGEEGEGEEGDSGCEKGTCEIGKPSAGCPDVPCREDLDACIYLAVPSVRPSDPTYSAGGVFAFDSIFSSAAARGVENATIRAMNATKACPDAKDCSKKDCDKKEPPKDPKG